MEDVYRSWDFLKIDDISTLTPQPLRFSRRPGPDFSRRTETAPAPAIQRRAIHVEAAEILPELPVTARTRPPNHVDTFKNVEEFGYGKWSEDGKQNRPGSAPFHKIPYSPSKRRGYDIGKSRQDVLQEKLRKETGKDYYQVLSIVEMGLNTRDTGRRHVQSPRALVRGHDFLYNHDVVMRNPAPVPPTFPREGLDEHPPEHIIAFQTPREKPYHEAVFVNQREISSNLEEEKLEFRRMQALEKKDIHEAQYGNVMDLKIPPNEVQIRIPKRPKAPKPLNKDERMFGPHMRRIAPPNSDETIDDVVLRCGKRQVVPQYTSPPVHLAQRSENRPSTNLGRTMLLSGSRPEQNVQRWSVNQVLAAGAPIEIS